MRDLVIIYSVELKVSMKEIIKIRLLERHIKVFFLKIFNKKNLQFKIKLKKYSLQFNKMINKSPIMLNNEIKINLSMNKNLSMLSNKSYNKIIFKNKVNLKINNKCMKNQLKVEQFLHHQRVN